MSVFEAVKQSVTTRQAAEMYGVKIRRGGMACCIFHNDKTPSMKVDNRFHCFGCQADGDVIDFTAQLFDLNCKDAAIKLASDFGISYDNKSHSPPKSIKRKLTKLSQEQQYQQTVNRCFRVLCDYLHILERWKVEYAPKIEEESWHPRFVEALQKTAYIEYLIDTLLYGEAEDKASLIVEKGKELIKLEQRIREIIASNSTGIEADNGRYGIA